LKILYLCPDLGIPVLGGKGASVHVREISAALSRRGHSVVVAASCLRKSPWDRPEHLDAQLLHVPPGDGAEAAFQTLKAHNELLEVENSLPNELRRIAYNRDLFAELERRFEDHPPDFIYERASLHTTAGVSLARALNRPLIIELNAPLAMEQSHYRGSGFVELGAQAERWGLVRADAVIAVSSALRDYVIALGVSPERVHVIPNGINADLFKPGVPDPALRARFDLGGGPVLGFVGGLRPWHGVEVLPALLERLSCLSPGLCLLVVGAGPLRGKLEAELAQRGLTRRAVFTGALAHAEVAALVRQFDVALAPYPLLDHPFYFSPLKLFEYMACGVPVVAAQLGQIAELVCDGETGLLYPAGDLDALTTACARLLADPELRQRLGRAAAREIHSRHTWDHNAMHVAELAGRLIEAREGG
jgi:glycosyltransferase involved in cell wall biosynthesis